jgi:bifunctional DNase/RNase
VNAVSRLLRLLPVLLVAACGGGSELAESEVAVEVTELVLDPGGNPVVLLRERGGARSLPIWIGLAEARSIAAKLERVEPPRPNTHDLAKRLLEGLGARVQRVVVTELRESTYYGLIVMEGPGGTVEVDARPSDAIALALRVDAPIFVREALFEEAALDEDEEEAPPPGREVLLRAPPRREIFRPAALGAA